MTPQDVITRVRDTINDTDSTAYRIDNDELLRYVNDGLDVAVTLVPQYFATTATHTAAAGAVQTLSVTRFVRILPEAMHDSAGAVTLVDKATLDAFDPDWRTSTAGTPRHWMKHHDDATFFVYPPAAGGESVDVPCIQAPDEFAIGATLPLPDSYLPALADYAVAREENKDDENVLNARAVQAFERAIALMKGA